MKFSFFFYTLLLTLLLSNTSCTNNLEGYWIDNQLIYTHTGDKTIQSTFGSTILLFNQDSLRVATFIDSELDIWKGYYSLKNNEIRMSAQDAPVAKFINNEVIFNHNSQIPEDQKQYIVGIEQKFKKISSYNQASNKEKVLNLLQNKTFTVKELNLGDNKLSQVLEFQKDGTVSNFSDIENFNHHFSFDKWAIKNIGSELFLNLTGYSAEKVLHIKSISDQSFQAIEYHEIDNTYSLELQESTAKFDLSLLTGKWEEIKEQKEDDVELQALPSESDNDTIIDTSNDFIQHLTFNGSNLAYHHMDRQIDTSGGIPMTMADAQYHIVETTDNLEWSSNQSKNKLNIKSDNKSIEVWEITGLKQDELSLKRYHFSDDYSDSGIRITRFKRIQ